MTFDKRLLPIAVLAASMTAVAAETKTIGQVTALIPEASTAGTNDGVFPCNGWRKEKPACRERCVCLWRNIQKGQFIGILRHLERDGIGF